VSDNLQTLAARIQAGQVSARAYSEQQLSRIRNHEGEVQAWVAVDESRATALADACDAARAARRPLGPLHGIPVGVKDIFDTADLATQMGSEIFAGHRPGRNAEVIERLIAAGGYVLGKTVTTEFAFMHPGKTRNPWDSEHTPGGSSSGSAAAVAAGFVPVAIGTQTNGSVIRPAAFCGVVGYKPTAGAIPYAGALHFSPTLDQVGIFARSVSDAAMFADCVADGALVSGRRAVDRPRIGYLKRFPWNQAEPEATAWFERALDHLAAAGARVEELSLPPEMSRADVTLRTIMLYEAARQHAACQAQHRTQMSPTLNAALDEGRALADDVYRAALNQRLRAQDMARALFAGFDAVATLPAPGPAPRRLDVTGDPSFCTLWSLLGFPAITVPTALANGLPLGIQFAALAGEDEGLLGTAQWCEARIGLRREPF